MSGMDTTEQATQPLWDANKATIWSRDPATGNFPNSNNLDYWRENRFNEAWPADKASADLVKDNDVTGLTNHWATRWLYPFQLEIDYYGPPGCVWARKNWWLPFVLAATYCFLVLYVGPKFMEKRKPYEWKRALGAWNLFLAVFSFMGMIRTAPHLIALLAQQGAAGVLCTNAHLNYGNGACGLWVALFIHSKYWEFLDTFFLIIRKKKVSLLHWYHHASVLLYCWDALMWETPAGILFVAMNYTVHAVMYFYYFLTSRGIFPKWAHWITKLQILQMVIGVGAVCAHLLLRRTYQNCDGAKENLYFAGVIYWSYFMLFADFYLERYGLKQRLFKVLGYQNGAQSAELKKAD